MTLSPRARWVILGFSALVSMGSCLFWSAASYAKGFSSAGGQGQRDDSWLVELSLVAFVLVLVAAWASRFLDHKHASVVVVAPAILLAGGHVVAVVLDNMEASSSRARSSTALAVRRAKFGATIAPMSRDFVCPDDEAYFAHAFITHDRARGVLIHFRWNDLLTDLYAEPIGRLVGDSLEWFHGVPNADGSNSRAYDECVDAEGRTVRQVYRGTNAENPRREDYGLERFRL